MIFSASSESPEDRGKLNNIRMIEDTAAPFALIRDTKHSTTGSRLGIWNVRIEVSDYL